MAVTATPEAALSAQARDCAILEHRELCRRGARRFLRAGLERSDLEQVAMLGLIKAVDRYDGRGGTPFPAFAWVMILSELGHYVRDREHLVRPPRRVRALERRHAAAWERLAQQLDREPHEAEVLSEISSRPDAAIELGRFRSVLQPTGLERAVVAGSLPPALWPDPTDAPAVASALTHVSERERTILVGLYWCGFSLAELGRRLGAPSRQIARLHRQAIMTIRKRWALEPNAG